MKKNLYKLLLLLLTASACDNMSIDPFQAESFIKFYTANLGLTGADVKQSGASEYVLLGTSTTYTSGSQICFVRTDEYGNSVDSMRFYGRSLNDQAYCLQVLSDGGFAILGSSQNPSTEKKEVMFIRTNSKGDPLWTRIIPSTNNVEAFDFKVDPNGSFFMIGYTDVGTTPPFQKDIWYFAIDENGNNLWPNPRTRGGTKDDVGTSLQLFDNGDIILSGNTFSYPSPSLTSHAFICKTNNSGILISSISVLDQTLTSESLSIQTDADENIYLAGSVKGNAIPDNDMMLAKVTYNEDILDIIWIKNFVNSGKDNAAGLVIGTDKISVLGTTSDGGSNTSITVITTDLDGELAGMKHYGYDGKMSGQKIEQTADDGFIIIGTNSYSENNTTMALIKTKEDASQ